MLTRRHRREAEELKGFYRVEPNSDEESGNLEAGGDSESEDNVESESAHESETDAEEYSEEDEDKKNSGKKGEPEQKRGRRAFLYSNSGFKWLTNAPDQRGRRSKSVSEHVPSPKGEACDAHLPIHVWNLLISDEILEIIVLHTNEEIQKRVEIIKSQNQAITFAHRPVDLDKMKAYIGMLYYAGVHKVNKTRLTDLWGIHSLPFFNAVMSRQRFCFLAATMRFDDKITRLERKEADKFTHVREIWDLFVANCTKYYEPDSNFTIDQQLLSF